jgi:hypothetical protein
MRSDLAFLMGEANRGREPMVFDWIKAAKRIKETGATEASAGLHSDWEYTGGCIFYEGVPVSHENTYTYLASTWATPELELDGKVEDCFIMQSERPDWDANTYWPPEALAVLKEEYVN